MASGGETFGKGDDWRMFVGIKECKVIVVELEDICKFENLTVEFRISEIAMNKFIINQIFVKRETFNVSNF